MTRKIGDTQTFYNYEIELDDEKFLCRNINQINEKLNISLSSISRKLKNPEYILRKYKDRHFKINIIRKPIFLREKKIIIEKTLIDY